MKFDVVIKGGTVVFHDRLDKVDIGVKDGKFAAIDKELIGNSNIFINAEGKYVFPGGYDCHVHFNDPGRTKWETISTGSRALAAGGMTMYSDMPLNSIPLTLDAPSFDAKLNASIGKSYVDYSFWGGMTPDNLDCLEELANKGVVGYKAFMCDSGIKDFRRLNLDDLYKGLKVAKKFDLPVVIHAEDEGIVNDLTKKHKSLNETDFRSFLLSRPQEAEVKSIKDIISVLSQTKSRVHIAHVSSPEAVELINKASMDGMDITCETTPLYLFFENSIFEDLRGLAKSCPPIRDSKAREQLWNSIANGKIKIVSSDHSPSSLDLKVNDNFFEIWGGISGCQNTLNVLLTEGFHNRNIPLEKLVNTVSYNPAKNFNIKNKGEIKLGLDADLSIVDIYNEFLLIEEELLYLNTISPYVNYNYKGRVETTMLRGNIIFESGRFSSRAIGSFVRPSNK